VNLVDGSPARSEQAGMIEAAGTQAGAQSVPVTAPLAESPPESPPPEPHRGPLREVMGRFATGVTIVSAGGPVPHGMTANAFTSVSLTPPLVLVCVKRSAAIHQVMLDCRSFAVSVLSAGQEQVARYFADHSRPRGVDEFDGVSWTPGPETGAPVIDGALAWLECVLTAIHEGGDHSILLGSVMASGHGPDDDALLFFGGGFHQPRLAGLDRTT
jgi:flavin reductase (DIM6/NTAB) family NADH-FMN oxidoreductase RutF